MRFKHILPAFLSLSLVCLLAACDRSADEPADSRADTPTHTQAETQATPPTDSEQAHTHAAASWQVTVPPTCTEKGTAAGSCVVCGESLEISLDQLPHSYAEIVTPPTCETEGYVTYTCACGYTYRGSHTPPTGHSYTESEIPPTCEEEGYTRYTCDCGYSYDSHHTPPTGHSYTESVIPSTCEEEGYTRYTCACGYSYDGHHTPPTGHSYTEAVILPTCTEAGYTHYECKVCGHGQDGAPVAPLAHANATSERFYPTLNRAGFTRHTCPDCGFTYEDGHVAYSDVVPGAYVDSTTVLRQGIDTSKWNHEYGASLADIKPLDFRALKAAGMDFVILKAGSTKEKDPAFEQDYLDAKAAGLQVGVYFYTYSATVEDTVRDVETLLCWLEGKQLEYPIYFDLEDASLSGLGGERLTELCLTFAEQLQEAGYYAALYTNTEWLYNLLDTETVKTSLDVWYARYVSDAVGGSEGFSPSETDFPWRDGTAYKPGEEDKRFGLWQYTCNGVIEGFRYRFDFNYAFRDYPSLMLRWGLNGFDRADVTPLAAF